MPALLPDPDPTANTEIKPEAGAPARHRLSPKKLLLSKWTAAVPQQREKHWLVVEVIAPLPPQTRIDEVALEAVHSGHRVQLPWRDLADATRWRRGWV
jgi:tryptophan-rich hypothetical protein